MDHLATLSSLQPLLSTPSPRDLSEEELVRKKLCLGKRIYNEIVVGGVLPQGDGLQLMWKSYCNIEEHAIVDELMQMPVEQFITEVVHFKDIRYIRLREAIKMGMWPNIKICLDFKEEDDVENDGLVE